MKETDKNTLAGIIRAHEAEILADWLKEQASGQTRKDQVHETEIRTISRDFLAAIVESLGSGASFDLRSAAWSKVRDILTELSSSRARQGFSPTETAIFVFSLKQPIFVRLRKEVGSDAQKLADEMWAATTIIDKLGLYTTEAYQKTREELIARQQRELLELSTPVVALWDDILALPL
ncbi:MAG TPA: RsbRD N-terminal domain-containing protein, partial [Usitatibacter sp.]|nr:RsbRD N-terminal domain-containing protein [Usitatibacter sp.]